MANATVNGISIHYRDTGGDAFPVVLAHGYTGNSRNWALTVPALRDRFRVVSNDHRGHGMSDKPPLPEDHSLTQMADDLYQLLRHLGIDKCYLVGHSMGGMISQLMTIAHAEVVQALVLVDTAADVPNLIRKARYEERLALVKIAEEEGMEAVFERQLQASVDPRIRDNPQFLAIWREQFLLTSAQAYIGGAREMASRGSVLDKLRDLRMPALVICGANDEPFLESSQAMHEAIPGSEYVIIQGAGHTPQIETPGAFNEVLTGFLTRVHERTATTA